MAALVGGVVVVVVVVVVAAAAAAVAADGVVVGVDVVAVVDVAHAAGDEIVGVVVVPSGILEKLCYSLHLAHRYAGGDSHSEIEELRDIETTDQQSPWTD